MKRIALISYHSPPMLSAESILVGKTVRRLADSYLIDVITAGDDPDFRNDLQLSEIMSHPNVNVMAYSTYRPTNKIVRRLMDKASTKVRRDIHQAWIQGVLRQHDWSRGYSVIYSRSQPGASHLVALQVKRRLKIPWIASFSDPWAYNPYHAGNPTIQKQEMDVVNTADQLIFPTIEILDLMRQHYPEIPWSVKGNVLPHCFEPSLYPAAEDRSVSESDLLTIAYIGDFYGLRSPTPLTSALSRLADKDPQTAERLTLRIVGNVESKFRPGMEEFRAQWPGKLEVLGQVPYLRSLELMKEADILVLVDAPSSVNLFLPSKLIDYFGAKRPIIGITPLEGTTANLLKKYGHAVVAPDDSLGVEEAIHDLSLHFQVRQRQVSHLEYDEFTAAHIAARIRDLIGKSESGG